MRWLPFDYAARNLGRSVPRLALTVLGSAWVVTLALTAAAFVRGMEAAFRGSGGGNNVVLLGAGSEESIERSEVDSSAAGIVAAAIPGIRSRAGVDYVSPEVHVMLPLTLDRDGAKGPLITVRGVVPAALLVHESVQIIDGRFPASGRDEVMVGRMLASKLGAADSAVGVGKVLYMDGRRWNIVGRFAAPGTIMDGEAWALLNDLKQATRRDTDSCITLTLDPAKAEFGDVAAFTKTRLDLELTAQRETDYYARLADFFAPIRLVVWVTAALIALGGLFGGLNTLYAAFASRIREFGMLQSLGFRRSAIIVSLMQESVLATATGALIACAVCMFLLDDVAVRFSMGVFGLRMDSVVMSIGLASGLALGVLGSWPPAWRCLRTEIPASLKSI